jgi:hypothetical protein
MGTNNMRQTPTDLVDATMVVTSWWAKISQAALIPIEKFVDWLEGVYAD